MVRASADEDVRSVLRLLAARLAAGDRVYASCYALRARRLTTGKVRICFSNLQKPRSFRIESLFRSMFKINSEQVLGDLWSPGLV